MSGLSWTSYFNDTISEPTDINVTYSQTISFFNSSSKQLISQGSITSLQTNDLATFGSTSFIAIQFSGYFYPTVSGNWTFNINLLPGQNKPDNFSLLFIGNANQTIVPNSTYTTISTSPSNTLPVAYQAWTGGGPTSTTTLNLIAGNYYPILMYYHERVGTSKLALSFTNPSGTSITDFTGYIVTSLPTSFICFKENSKILTDKGYIPIENLRKGDLVQTLRDGLKPITMIGKRDIYHVASKEKIKDQLYQCSSNEFPEIFEPLVITGCHCILVDDFKKPEYREKMIDLYGDIYITDNKYRLPACIDERTIVFEKDGYYTIYHFALEHPDYFMNYGIYANGLLVETCSERNLKELSNMDFID